MNTAAGQSVYKNRVNGKDKHEINDNVINKFYTETNLDDMIVAKSDVLVDALTAGPLAAKLNAPILLNPTNSVSSYHEDTLKDNSADFAGSESILDWLRQFASKEEDDNTFLRGFLGRMLFSGDEVNKSVNVLSGGEKVRVMLSKLMLLKSNVLVLDDPTNHLDLESISSLNDGLKNFKESIIFASHDHEFIQTLANHIIVLSKNGVIDRIDETYDEFLENQEVQQKVKELWKD